MERKVPVDLVILQFAWPHDDFEALAARDGKVINAGSIPYIFSNYKGEELFHAQGNALVCIKWQAEQHEFQIDTSVDRIVGKELEFALVVHFNKAKNVVEKKDILAVWKGKEQIYFNANLIDEHWDEQV